MGVNVVWEEKAVVIWNATIVCQLNNLQCMFWNFFAQYFIKLNLILACVSEARTHFFIPVGDLFVSTSCGSWSSTKKFWCHASAKCFDVVSMNWCNVNAQVSYIVLRHSLLNAYLEVNVNAFCGWSSITLLQSICITWEIADLIL